jgi:hypothetical protein
MKASACVRRVSRLAGAFHSAASISHRKPTIAARDTAAERQDPAIGTTIAAGDQAALTTSAWK